MDDDADQGLQGIHEEEEEEEEADLQDEEDPDHDDDSPVAQVHGLIQTSNWEILEQVLVNLIPTRNDGSHPSQVHPFLFLTIWRRRIMDLIEGGAYGEAARIFRDNVHPLKSVVTAYAFPNKLQSEIAKIESSVGSKTSVAHAHCGTVLMQKLIIDYLSLYLPDCIGYASPKRKHSAMWEFAVRLDPPVLGVYKSHADIRCLVCSEEEYTNCNIGVKMEGHLQVCPGLTPEASRRYSEALKKKSKRKRSDVIDDINSLPSSKRVKVTTVADHLHIIYQKVEEGKGILDGMSRVQQDLDVKLGVDAMKSIFGDIWELVASALQHQAPAAAQVVPQAPQAHAPPVDVNALLQALIHAQVLQPPLVPHPPSAHVPQSPQAPAPLVDANALLQAIIHAQAQDHAPAHGQVQLQAPPAPHPPRAPAPLVDANALLQALIHAQAPVHGQVQLQAPQARHPAVQAPGQVPLQLQAPQGPHPAVQAPGQVPLQLQAPQGPHPAVQAPGQVPLQAPQGPHPAVQAPGQMPLQAPHPAAAPLQAPLADNEDEEDYYQEFGDLDFLPDLPDLSD